LAFFMGACGSAERKAEAQASVTEEVPAVAAAKAAVQDISRKVVLTAEFIPFQEVDVMAKVSGYVQEIRVDVGDHVRLGQTLAIIEIPEMQDDVARAQATIEQAEAEVTGARDEVHRAESSHDIAHLSYQRLAGVVKV
jgi:multidrug efflux pump subunit AcrA (membrane-fusion protein)